MDSVFQDNKECWVCHRTGNLHSHHIFGAANRKWSEKYGLKLWLCPEHHNMSDAGIHFNKELDDHAKQMAQLYFELMYGADKFMEIFGRNYLPSIKVGTPRDDSLKEL